MASFRHGEVVQQGEGPGLIEVKEKEIQEGWGLGMNCSCRFEY